MPTPFQYIVLHQSCRKFAGVAAVQAAHAATECLRRLPVSPQTTVAVLVAETSMDLESLSGVLAVAGIHHALVREPDPPYHGAAVALGVEPTDRQRVAPHMRSFKPFR